MKLFKNKIPKHGRRVAGFMVAAACAVSLTAGCGAKVSKDQIAFRTYGLKCLSETKYDDAIQAFNSALENSNGSITDLEVDICLYKAKAQYLSGDHVSAMETYTALIDYDDIPEAYFQRACLNMLTGNMEDAVSDFDAAVENNKNNYEVYIGAYESLSKEGHTEEADKYLESAMNISGKKMEDYLNRGRIAFLQKDYENAEKLLEEALSQGSVDANYYLSEVFHELGDAGQEKAYLEAYLQSDKITADELVKAGQSKLLDGDYEQAITLLESARGMEGLTSKAETLKSLATAYEFRYDFASAREVLKEYTEMNPDDQDAARELIFLENR